jgi:uncharacterized membrane protein YebE (DUF533 family)
MIRKIVGAALGAKIARNSPVAGGAAGAVIGTALPFVLSRVALPGLAAIGAGAYAFNHYRKRRSAAEKAAGWPRSDDASGPRT